MSTERLVTKLTLREIDRRLIAMTEEFKDAIRDGRLEDADAAYAELDDLLEQRFHVPAAAPVMTIPMPRTPYNPADAYEAALHLMPPHQDRPPLWRRLCFVQAQDCAACGIRWWWPTYGQRPTTCPSCKPGTLPASWSPAQMRTALHLIERADTVEQARRLATAALR